MVMTLQGVSEWKRYWPLPLSAALGYSTAVLYTYGFGPFIAPVQEAFGWSRAQVSIGITIAGLTGACLSVPMGMVVDRLGPRVVGLTGVVLMALAIALLGTADGTTGNWILLWAFVAFANLWLQATVWTSAVATRFEHARGLAFGLTLSGGSLTATVAPLLAATFIASHGWRTAFAVVGGAWAIVVLPIVFLCFRSGRAQKPSTPSPAGAPPLAGVPVREALRTPAFYKLLAASWLFAFAGLGTVVHFVPILGDRGANALDAAAIASLIGITSAIGRLGTGLLLDRLLPHLVGACVFVLPVIACALLLLDGESPMSQAIAACCLGLAVGAEVDVIAYLTAKRFGLKNYGVIFGAMIGALALGTALGPLAASVVFDSRGTYAPFLIATLLASAMTSIAVITLRTDS